MEVIYLVILLFVEKIILHLIEHYTGISYCDYPIDRTSFMFVLLQMVDVYKKYSISILLFNLTMYLYLFFSACFCSA